MEWEVLEILEEKIEQAVKKLEVLSKENVEFEKKIKDKDAVIKSAQDRIDALEEEKELIRSKVDGILKKISQAVG